MFICCDLPYLYISEYFAKLDETDFRPINNSDLLGVDSYPYLDDWEISLEDAHTRLASSAPVPTLATSSRSSPLPEEATSAYSPAENPAIVLDLRNNEDFNLAHFSNAINFDLRLRGQPNPFTKSAILISQWKAFDSRLIQNSRLLAAKSEGRPIIVVCYNGNSAKIATSVLRHHGWEAWFVSGGLQAWTHEPNIRARL